MKNSATFWRNLAITLPLTLLLGGCGGGGSSSPAVPAVATVFYAHSLAFGNNSTIKAWGYNGFGQLGFAQNSNTNGTPQVVQGLPKLSQANGGFSMGATHSVAFKNNSSVWAWGWNAYGQLGANTSTNTFSPTPVQVTGFSRTQAVSAGGFHTLALTAGPDTDAVTGQLVKNVWAWGLNSLGQLGDGTTIYGSSSAPTAPVKVKGTDGAAIADITKIAAGGSHSLALKVDPTTGVTTLYAWGDNSYGQLGVATSPSSTFSPVAVTVPITGKIKDIAAGGAFSLAVTDDGRVWAWGYNGIGQLGVDPAGSPPVPFRVTPTVVAQISNVQSVSAGLDHVLALKTDGTVWGWGFNFYGQLGNGGSGGASLSTNTPVIVPVQVTGLTLVSSNRRVLAFGNNSYAFDGASVWAWGDNAFGQLGNGTTDRSIVPILVGGLR
jgi:alpha-tubulin suppressor-like RCC1 family protein